MMLTDPLVEAFPANAPSVSGGLPEIQTNIIPWNDLEAVNVPEQWPLVTPNFQPTLSALIGKSPRGPRLVGINEAGMLQSSSPPQLLDSFNTGNIQNATFTKRYQLSSGVHALAVAWTDTQSAITEIQVKGASTGTVYHDVFPGSDGLKFYIFPIIEPLEDRWEIDFISSINTFQSNVKVVEIFEAIATWTQTQKSFPESVVFPSTQPASDKLLGFWTQNFAGVVTAPIAGQKIVTTGAQFTGFFDVEVCVGYGGTGDGASNMLFASEELTGTRIPHPGLANSFGPVVHYRRVRSQVGLTSFWVAANAAGVTGSVYIATIRVTPLSG